MKNKTLFLALVCLLFIPHLMHAQNIGINNNDGYPACSALLHVKSTDKDILIPRMTSVQRTTNTFWFYKDTLWTRDY